MLLIDDLAFHLAVGAGVSAVEKIEGIAAADRAVAQNHDAVAAADDAVQKSSLAVVKPIPDHDLAPLPGP